MNNGIYVRVNGQWEEVSTTEDNVTGKIEIAKNEAISDSKEYTDTKISEIPEVDLSKLETKTDATAKLQEAKQYTDEKIGDVDLSALETKEDATAKLEEAKGYTDSKTKNMETTQGSQLKVDAHASKTDNPHKVTKSQIGLSNVDNVKQASKADYDKLAQSVTTHLAESVTQAHEPLFETYREKLVTLTGTSPLINLDNGNTFKHDLSGNTTYAVTNAISEVTHSFTLIITQPTTVRTVTFPSNVKWQDNEIPDMTTGGKTFILTFLTINGGSTWYGMSGGVF